MCGVKFECCAGLVVNRSVFRQAVDGVKDGGRIGHCFVRSWMHVYGKSK